MTISHKPNQWLKSNYKGEWQKKDKKQSVWGLCDKSDEVAHLQKKTLEVKKTKKKQNQSSGSLIPFAKKNQ